MPSNHLIFCHPLLPLPSIFPSIRVFSNIQGWFISGLTDLITMPVQRTLKNLFQHHSLKPSVLQHSAFFMVQLSHPHMTSGKTTALTRQTFVSQQSDVLLKAKFWVLSLCKWSGFWKPFAICGAKLPALITGRSVAGGGHWDVNAFSVLRLGGRWVKEET